MFCRSNQCRTEFAHTGSTSAEGLGFDTVDIEFGGLGAGDFGVDPFVARECGVDDAHRARFSTGAGHQNSVLERGSGAMYSEGTDAQVQAIHTDEGECGPAGNPG